MRASRGRRWAHRTFAIILRSSFFTLRDFNDQIEIPRIFNFKNSMIRCRSSSHLSESQIEFTIACIFWHVEVQVLNYQERAMEPSQDLARRALSLARRGRQRTGYSPTATLGSGLSVSVGGERTRAAAGRHSDRSRARAVAVEHELFAAASALCSCVGTLSLTHKRTCSLRSSVMRCPRGRPLRRYNGVAGGQKGTCESGMRTRFMSRSDADVYNPIAKIGCPPPPALFGCMVPETLYSDG